MKLIIYISLFCISFEVNAQNEISYTELETYLDMAQSFYSNADYEILTTIKTFKGHRSNEPQDIAKGYIRKKGKDVESYQFGTYSVQNKDMKVVLDSVSQEVGVTYSDKSIVNTFDNDEKESQLRKIDRILISDRGGLYKITIKFKKGYDYQSISYLLEETGFMKEITFLYAREISYETSDGKMDQEKLKIVLNFLLNKSKSIDLKNTVTTIVKYDKNNIELLTKFKAFELLDYRYQN